MCLNDSVTSQAQHDRVKLHFSVTIIIIITITSSTACPAKKHLFIVSPFPSPHIIPTNPLRQSLPRAHPMVPFPFSSFSWFLPEIDGQTDRQLFDLYIYIYRFIEVWQPKAGLHTDNQYIHAYNADRNKTEIGLLKIN